MSAEAPSRCPGCGTQWGPRVLACPGCAKLVHASALERLAAEARSARDADDRDGERAAWERALALLPPSAKQAATIRDRVDALAPEPGAKGAKSSHAPRWLASLGAVGLLLWKAKAILAFLATKGKLILAGAASWKTALSVFVSFGVYWVAWGWPFALGVVGSLYVHELGHVVALKRYGIPASAPMFIPGVGAFVRLDQRPATPVQDARVGLAGPWAGLGATLVVYSLYLATGHAIFAALTQVGAFLNLFNLIPVWQLDGSRGFASLTRKERGLAAAAIGVAMLATGALGAMQWLLAIPLVAAIARSVMGEAPETGDRFGLAQYVVLFFALSALASVSVPGAAALPGVSP